MNFPFGTNGKFIILGVPILKHIGVVEFHNTDLDTWGQPRDGKCSLIAEKLLKLEV